MREELHTTEELPAGILHPSIYDIFIAEILLKLQDVQSNHQPRAAARGACGRGLGWLELALKSFQEMRTASFTSGCRKPIVELG
jgi:hypothetical protein